MQSYSIGTLVMLVITACVAVYAYSPTLEASPRVRAISDAKPQLIQIEEIEEAVAATTIIESSLRDTVAEPSAIVEAAPSQLALTNSSAAPEESVRIFEGSLDVADETDFEEVAAVEEESDTAAIIEEDDSAAVTDDAVAATIEEEIVVVEPNIQSVAFATRIDDNFNPVSARYEFPTGSYTVYATFDYAGIENGTPWSWIWKHNGIEVGGGSQAWEHGDSGPGWVYFSPDGGFSEGEYTLEIWLDGELATQSGLDVSSGVANQ